MIKNLFYESLIEASTIDYDEYTKKMNLPFTNSKPDVVFDLTLRNILNKSSDYKIELIPVHITSREFYLFYDKLNTKNLYFIMNFNSYKNSYYPRYSKELNKKFNSDIINEPYLFSSDELGINDNFNEKVINDIFKNYNGNLKDINNYCVVTYYFKKNNQLSHLKNYLFDRYSYTYLIEDWLNDDDLKPLNIVPNINGYGQNDIQDKSKYNLDLKPSSIEILKKKGIIKKHDLPINEEDNKKEEKK